MSNINNQTNNTKSDHDAPTQELSNKLSAKEVLQKINEKVEVLVTLVAMNTVEIKILRNNVDKLIERLDSFEKNMDKKFDIVFEKLGVISAKLDKCKPMKLPSNTF